MVVLAISIVLLTRSRGIRKRSEIQVVQIFWSTSFLDDDSSQTCNIVRVNRPKFLYLRRLLIEILNLVQQVTTSLGLTTCPWMTKLPFLNANTSPIRVR